MAALFWIFALTLFAIAMKCADELWRKPKTMNSKLRRRGIYGPSQQFHQGKDEAHVAGNQVQKPNTVKMVHDIVPLVDHALMNLASTYGKTVAIWKGGVPHVIVMDPTTIREILSNVEAFHKPEVHWSMKYFICGLANINGKKWAAHRKILNPAFHIDKLKLSMPAFTVCCENLVGRWENLIGDKDSYELDVLPEFLDMTGDVIARAAFGSNFEESRAIFQLQLEQSKLFLKLLCSSNLPWSRFLPSRLKKQMTQTRDRVSALIGSIIDKQEKNMAFGDAESNNLLSLLLKSNLHRQRRGEGNTPEKWLTREEIIEECKLFYFAGHETTANLLAWTMITLSMHQDWQEKVREEILHAFGREEKPAFEQLNRLKLVNMVLLEVLRLYPPTSICRWTTHDVKVEGLALPAGVAVQMPLYMVHRDKEIWGENAMEFDPGRFENGGAKATKDMLAFGWGPRTCIGQNFALIEAKLALTLLLQRFRFHLSPTYNHSPAVRITLQPKHGAQIVLHRL